MASQGIEGFPLSPRQRHLWKSGTGSTLRVQGTFFLEGRLDRGALASVLEGLVDEHEILRTSFEVLDGVPVQVIAERIPGRASWTEIDLSARPPEEQRHEMATVLERERRSAAELSSPGLLRLWLAQLGSESHALLLSLPALCSDGRSLRNLFRELARSYAAPQAGTQGDEPMQYVDFAAWSQSLVDEARSDEAGRRFWRDQDFESCTRRLFPFESPPAASSAERRSIVVSVGPSRRAALEAIADQIGLGLEMILLTAWQVLVWRYSGQNRSMIGVVSDGRRFEDLLSGVGPYAHAVPILSTLRGSETFAELAAQAASRVEEGLRHFKSFNASDVAAPQEGDADLPLGFAFEAVPGPVSKGGLRFRFGDGHDDLEDHHLALACLRRGEELDFRLTYDPRRFVNDDVEAMGRGLDTLLDSLVADPAGTPRRSIGSFEAVDKTDRRQLAAGLRGRREAAPRAVPIQALFERQVRRSPGAAALVSDSGTLKYGELNRRANRLAHRLRMAGLEPEERVAILLERSPEMVVAVLAVLKAGGAYVALDREAPPARLAAILDDSGARLVLSLQALASHLPPGKRELICLDTESDRLEGLPATDPPSVPDCESLAYVAYTSGSTGSPKGVLSHHRGVVSYLGYLRSICELGALDRVIQVAPLGFDASVRDLLGPLTSGASVVLVPDGEARDPGALLDRIARHRVSAVLSIVPTVLRAVLAAASAQPSVGDHLRLVLVSGEPLFEDDCRRFYELVPRAELVNHYGPTEATMTSSFERLSTDRLEDPEGAGLPMALGRPRDGVRFELLNRSLRAAVPTVGGEIGIGGVGLARGYLGGPGATAERFVPDPYGITGGERIYRTGDRANLDSGGRLRFRGRLDHQVKLRGVRVEPGEIDAALRRHGTVADACTTLWQAATGEAQLVAYVTPRSAEVSSRELRDFLRRQLPEILVPSRVLIIDEMPRRPNGKIDRSALPAPDGVESAERAAPASQTQIEELLAGIWAELLDVQAVEPGSSFFELGGHSLLAIQVASRVREVFEVNLPVPAFFEAPTLAELAAELERRIRTARGIVSPPIEKTPRDRVLPLSYTQERQWFLTQLDPGASTHNNTSATHLEGPLDVGALERGIDEIVRRHEILRTTYAMTEDGPAQRVAPHRPMKVPRIDLRRLGRAARESELRRFAAREVRRPFDLERGPVLRFYLIALSESENVILVACHHIAMDFWALGVLSHELATLYQADLSGRPSPLAEIDLQFADFAHWQRRWLRGEMLDAHVDYWRRTLEGGPARLELPTDRLRPAVQNLVGARRSFALDEGLTAALEALAAGAGATLYMTLLTAWKVLLHHLSGQDDIVVGTPVAGRDRKELEKLIGCFINALVLRTDLSGDPTFAGLVDRVRRVSLGAYAHTDLPFEKLVEELQPKRDPSTPPIFQVVFNYQSAPFAEVDVEGLTLRRFEIDVGRSKYDLTLYMGKVGGRLEGGIEYAASLFDADTIDGFLDGFGQILEKVAVEPGARLSGLSALLSDHSRERRAFRRRELGRVNLGKLRSTRRRSLALVQEPAEARKMSAQEV